MNTPAFRFATNTAGILLFLFARSGAAGTTTSSEPVAARGIVAVVDAQLVTMENERVVDHQSIIIRDGRITQIGPASDTLVPEGARRIEAKGKYLMPGVIDCFCHVDGVGTLLPYVANGVTTVRNTAGGFTTHLGIRDRIARGELFGPTILSTGGDITSLPPNFSSQEPVTTAEHAARIVTEVKRLGFDGIMVYSRISPEVQKAVTAAARRLGLPVTGHACLAQKIAETARSGQRSVDNLIGLVLIMTGAMGFSDDVAQDTGRLLREGGVSCIPTLTVRRARSGKQLAQPAELRYFARSQRGNPSEAFGRLANTYRYEGAPRMVSILHQEGVKILLGTDAGYIGVLPGFSLHGPYGELQNLVGAGLSPYEAIRAGTRDAAEFLGQLDQIGTVSVGKRADLILVDGNPLNNVAHVGRISGVVLRGRWLPRAELQAMLDNQAESYRRPTSRFAGLPPLPHEGRQEFSGRYALRQGPVVIGEERLVIHRLADGRRVLDSQASLDPYFDTSTVLHAEVGTGSRGESVTISRQAADGTANLLMKRSGGMAQVSGTRPYYGEIRIEEPLGPDVILAGPMLANNITTDMAATFTIAAESLSALRIGQSVDLQLKQLELNPDEFFRNATVGDTKWSVTRKDAPIPTPDGGCRGCRSYEITTAGRAGTGVYKTRLIVDEQQRPWRVVVQTDGGEDILQRV
jgi:imidazolonepropionase-like amidohydrolase